MECACATLYRLDDNEARQYAAEHLTKTGHDYKSWAVAYECEATGRTWILDYPDSEYHGGGPPRLRQVDNKGVPIEKHGIDPYR